MDYQSQASELKPMSASKVENQFNNLMFKRWLERMESVHVLQYQLNHAHFGALWRCTFCAAVALGAERDLPAVQSLRRGAWQEDTAGGDGDRLDSFCSWSMSYHLSLPVCMPLSSAANPDSVLPHASCCPLFTVFCCVLSQAVPHPLPLSVSISLSAIYHPGPFKSIL